MGNSVCGTLYIVGYTTACGNLHPMAYGPPMPFIFVSLYQKVQLWEKMLGNTSSTAFTWRYKI